MTTEGSERFDLTESLIAEPQGIDTPTVCNALEVLAPERSGYGHTAEHRPRAGPSNLSAAGRVHSAA
jgi:hypothetical protein